MTEKEEICCQEHEVHRDLQQRVMETMPAETQLYDLAELFKIFGDSTRIRILDTLTKKELCVQEIADELSMTQSAISHQLRILKQGALVKFRREGKTIFYLTVDGDEKYRYIIIK